MTAIAWVGKGALLGLLALGVGCRAAAPERVALGASAYGARRYLGALPFWEGPDPYGQGIVSMPHAFAVSTERERHGMLAEIWREGGRVQVASEVLPGSVVVEASDGRGNLVYFRRPLTTEGDLYDLENDRLYLGDLRGHAPPRSLDVPPHQGGQLTAVCGYPGRFVAWVSGPAGYEARTFSAAAPAGTAVAPQRWSPFWCAADERCSAAVLDRGAEPQLLRTDCDGRILEEALEDRWPTSTVLHPRGTLASFQAEHRKSTVVIRLPGGRPRTFALDGTAYAATYWNPSTLLVHVADGATDQPTHLRVVVLDAERGPIGEWNLDFARSASDRRALSDLALLPSRGNGRPLVVRLDDELVLITGPGEVWTWRGGAP
ncbi:MAG TPA: hypothetical protein VHU40_11130 [Polyangia bacterium]|nr:hypothetical protein [Polyangia bacterium]